MSKQLSSEVYVERRGGVVTRVVVAALAALLLLSMLASPMARPAQAQVATGDRSVEVFYERDMVLITGYEPGANVKIDVLRNDALVGSVTGTVGADGTLEINHTGASAGDCWGPSLLDPDAPNVTPDIKPGDTVQTTILSGAVNGAINSATVRDIALDFDALVADEGDPDLDNDGTITVKGHARSTEAAPIDLEGGDILGIGLRKENRDSPWGDGQDGRKVMTAELTASDINPDGSFTYIFRDIVEEDVEDVQLNGVAQSFEWSPATEEPAAPSELTVYDASEGVPPGCPPLEGAPTGSVDEPVPNVNQDLNSNADLSAPVESGRTIEVVHGIEFVLLNNYPANTEVRVDVVRGQSQNAVVVGSTTQRTDGTGLLEINHLGEGQFPDGDCWNYPGTPDIHPGDTVMATVLGPQGKDTADVDTTVVRDVFLNSDQPEIVDLDGPTAKLVVSGHAKSATAAPINAGDILEVRFNKNNSDNRWESGDGLSQDRADRKDLRGNVDAGTLPSTGEFTHEFIVSDDDANDVRSNGVEMGIEWSPAVVEPEEPSEITVFNGTALETVGCPPLLGGTPANSAANAITGSSHQFVNAANMEQGQITLSGVSYGKDEVNVSVAGGTEVPATLSPVDPANQFGLQTWRATLDVNLADLPQGPIEASASFVDSEAGTVVWDTGEMMKDTDAPGAPAASKPSGEYTTAQRVTLSAEEGARIYYSITGGSEPVTDALLYTSPIRVNETQTISAVAVDKAGNVSVEESFNYTITPPPNTRPTVTRTTPTDGVTIRNKRPTIAATVTDAETNLSRNNIRLIIRGEEIRTFSYNRTTDRLTYTPRKNLRVGQTPVRVIATDEHGGRVSEVWSFIVRR